MTARVPLLTTLRLELMPMTVAALDAMIDGDGQRLAHETGACFPEPLVAPPLMEDALPYIRDRVREEPDDLVWWAWLIVSRETGEAIGSAGFAGRPDADGTVVLGYAIYPVHEKQGYATEASQALTTWALEQADVRAVRAKIPPGHTPSIRVAEKLGMRVVGRDHDDEVGEILVFGVARPG
jgi:[ribosomal protein S5]-alanine N-acetyltransferase